MSEETEEERHRRFARERKRRQRERQSPSDAAAARAKDNIRRKFRLSQENEYEREMRRRNECMRKRLQRLRASQGEMLERRRIEKERIAGRREQLSQEEIEDRRKVERERIAFKRRNSSQEEIEERRRVERERIAERRGDESDEAAQQRREKNAENMRRLRAKTRVGEVSSSATTTVSSVSNFWGQHDSLFQPTAAKFCKRPGSQIDNQCFENLQQKSMTNLVQPSLPTHFQMPVQQSSLSAPKQVLQTTLSALKQVQMLATPVQVLAPPAPVAMAKLKPVENPRPREKKLLAIPSHQRDVMSSLVSLWKSGKLCDASIGNGSSTIKVHKLVLSALCPKLVSVFNMDTMSSKFLAVNFPKEVSTEALNAFTEYMYNGILDLDPDILEQLKIIAKRLDMKEFEDLCNSHLPKDIHPTASAAVSLLDTPLFQRCMSIPAATSSLGSTGSTSTQSSSSVTSQVIDIKQEISEVKKEAAAVFGHESKVTSLASNKSGGNTPSECIISRTSVKTEDDKYGHYRGGNNQAFTSATSSLIAAPTAASSSIAEATIISTSIPSSSTEFTIPFSETDVKLIRLKVPHFYEPPLVPDLSPVSNIVEMLCTQSSPKNEHISNPLVQASDSQLPVNLAKTSNCNNAVYPVRLFSAKGDNLPLLAKHTSTTMTINSFIQNEKT